MAWLSASQAEPTSSRPPSSACPRRTAAAEGAAAKAGPGPRGDGVPPPPGSGDRLGHQRRLRLRPPARGYCHQAASPVTSRASRCALPSHTTAPPGSPGAVPPTPPGGAGSASSSCASSGGAPCPHPAGPGGGRAGSASRASGAAGRSALCLRSPPGAVIFAPMSDVTRILTAIEQGDPHAAEQLLPLVYDELR